MPLPVGVMVLFPFPMLVMGWPLVVVPLDERVWPDEAETGEVTVAKVLPSKSEGTVGLGARSSPVRLRWEPDNVTTDGDGELLWAAARPASHSSETTAPFMIATGVGRSPDVAKQSALERV